MYYFTNRHTVKYSDYKTKPKKTKQKKHTKPRIVFVSDSPGLALLLGPQDLPKDFSHGNLVFQGEEWSCQSQFKSV